jgi:hypothetical protein
MPVEYYDDDEMMDEEGDSIVGVMILICFEAFMLLGLYSMGFRFTD